MMEIRIPMAIAAAVLTASVTNTVVASATQPRRDVTSPTAQQEGLADAAQARIDEYRGLLSVASYPGVDPGAAERVDKLCRAISRLERAAYLDSYGNVGDPGATGESVCAALTN